MDASTTAYRTQVAARKPGTVAKRLIAGLVFGSSLMFGMAGGAKAQTTTTCTGGPVPPQGMLQPSPAEQPILLVTGNCTVVSGTEYFYGNVNILNGGTLRFPETANSPTEFWASAIIIENGGTMTAGTPTEQFGMNGGTLKIHLYGKDLSSWDPIKQAFTTQNQGALCKSTPGVPSPGETPAPCGIPQKPQWESNGAAPQMLPGGVTDFFYQYGPLYGDGQCDDKSVWINGKCPNGGKVGYFGVKTLAVSFGGTLELYGYKGASSTAIDNDHTNSGVSWIRLAADIKKDDTSLTLATDPGGRWKADDQIVVTTTDYLPGHSEQLTIATTYTGGTTVLLTSAIQWTHIGVRYGGPADSDHPKLTTRLPNRIKDSIDSDLVDKGAETRAAVALLTRSIQIVSEGDGVITDPTVHIETFNDATLRSPCPDGRKGCYYFGAHMVVRQGFKQVQIQGVEFKQMGQGGRLGHYPVHFHMARQTPPGTFVKDSSVNESMTRWFVIHSTQGVTLARNVGWKSIGHGYYLEDATETDNNFYSNLGIFARAAVDNIQNPRKVPGILSYNGVDAVGFPYRSDNEYPSVFWITNGWNDFIGNMAAGAGTCGACYWFEPAENSDMPDVPDNLPVPPNCPSDGMHTYMKWSGYAGLQTHQCATKDQNKFSVPSSFAGTVPIKSFYKNYCTSAMHSFQTTQDAPVCSGVWASRQGKAPNILTGVESIAPKPTPTVEFKSGEADDPYYPHYIGARSETRCPLAPPGDQIPGLPPQYNCSAAVPCANNDTATGTAEEQCGVTVIDHYTSAFNWAQNAVAAVWLRPKWYLIDNSVLSDVQSAALTFVTSGNYDRSAVIEGDWALARNTVFIGNTQTGNPYASNAGPFNKGGPLGCDGGASPKLYCLNSNEGITMPLVDFSVAQRFFSIYDGPSYEDSNVYLDIKTTPCADDSCMYGSTTGVRKDGAQCYLPNAAIAWKQPNGFYYPPAFHSNNLFFDNVDIRHYVIDALWKPGTYLTDFTATGVPKDYCTSATDMFNSYSDIDRQTELNDDDGSLTGLTNKLVTPGGTISGEPTGTISVNPDHFFDAPVETPECLSNLKVHPTATCAITQETPTSATTSPYDYVTTAVISECGVGTGKPNPGRCGDQTKDEFDPMDHSRKLQSIGRSGIWSQECSNPACYGIPLYRQFLTGNDGTNGMPRTREWATWYDIKNKCNENPTTTQCRFPFVRMGGQATYQRSTLTVNHGTYYLDTTVPRDIQYGSSTTMQGEPFTDIIPCEFKDQGACQPRSVNVFQGDQTYYVYFLFAKAGKEATQQTYQIYVGDGFNVGTDVQAVQADLKTVPSQGITPKTWPADWKRNYNDAVACPNDNKRKCGILQVTVDFTNINLDLTSANGLCQPHTFCCPAGSPGCKAKPNPGKTCGCAFDKTDPRAQASSKPDQVVDECNYVCGEWAVKDLDFPDNGMALPKYFTWGFSFKLPSKPPFMPDATLANPSPHRPLPTRFPETAATGKPDWLTLFDTTKKKPDNEAGGQCFYDTKVPGTDCPVP